MNKDEREFFDKGTDLLDEHFPKGQSRERGEAIVVLAQLNIFYRQKIKEIKKRIKKRMRTEWVI